MFKERFFHTLFALCAMGSIFAVCAICFFLFANAIPTMKQIGFMDFIFGLDWYPEQEFFGILAYDYRQSVCNRSCYPFWRSAWDF